MLTENELELSVSMQQPMTVGDMVNVAVESHDLVLFELD